MKRLVLAILFSVAALGTAMAQSLPAMLKPVASIQGDTVTLGDLWDNLGAKAATVIANSPQPGKRVTADARWLSAVAQKYQVDWRPSSDFDRIVIERAGQSVDAGQIEDSIKEALVREGVAGPLELEVANRGALEIVVPADVSTEVGVRDVAWDARTSRFSATIEIPAGSPTANRQRINGRYFTIARVPVLNHALSKGDAIGNDDINWTDVRADAVRADIVLDPRQMIGLEPRRAVRAGIPVRLSELQRPVLVTRNSTVTMVLQTPYMALTVQGRASEDGGRGDVVRVTNLQTKRVVEGVVDGPSRVLVTPNSAMALAN